MYSGLFCIFVIFLSLGLNYAVFGAMFVLVFLGPTMPAVAHSSVSDVVHDTFFQQAQYSAASCDSNLTKRRGRSIRGWREILHSDMYQLQLVLIYRICSVVYQA